MGWEATVTQGDGNKAGTARAIGGPSGIEQGGEQVEKFASTIRDGLNTGNLEDAFNRLELTASPHAQAQWLKMLGNCGSDCGVPQLDLYSKDASGRLTKLDLSKPIPSDVEVQWNDTKGVHHVYDTVPKEK